jgi:geranylgeranyl pyrophosphate synthase
MADMKDASKLDELLGPYARRSQEQLARLLVEPGVPAPLAEAMRYCILPGGKRLRPAIVWMSAEAVASGGVDGVGGVDAAAAGQAAAAVELVHGYSLVHDDLPAMDDDTLRRGRPTAHVKFGQAMAILAGDALLTRAFGLLAEAPAELAGPLAEELAIGAGPAGMIAGQVADMGLCPMPAGLDGVRYIHARKTAALIRASARMGGLCGRGDERAMAALSDWSASLGLAFQMVDDLLDVTADAEQLGKTPGKDAGAGKHSAATVVGVPAARTLVGEISDRAALALAPLGAAADKLRELTDLLVRRTR